MKVRRLTLVCALCLPALCVRAESPPQKKRVGEPTLGLGNFVQFPQEANALELFIAYPGPPLSNVCAVSIRLGLQQAWAARAGEKHRAFQDAIVVSIRNAKTGLSPIAPGVLTYPINARQTFAATLVVRTKDKKPFGEVVRRVLGEPAELIASAVRCSPEIIAAERASAPGKGPDEQVPKPGRKPLPNRDDAARPRGR